MSRHVFILGGTGQIGRAVASEFLAANWGVTISHRGTNPAPADLVERGAKVVMLDRDTPGQLSGVLGSGADALIDTMAFDREHRSQLINVQASVGCFIVISSASVYRDDHGRTLDEAPQNGFPELPEGIRETQPTVDPGPATYSTRKVALERHLLDDAATPVTILRPGAINGLNSRFPREWWVVKRILDRRPAIPLAYRGTSRFHTSALPTLPRSARVAVEVPESRVLNIGDPSPPTVAQIATLVAQHLDYDGRIVHLGEENYPPAIGRTPWSVPRPFLLDCQTALDLDYSPASTYVDAIKPVCDWLVETAPNGDWKERFPILARNPRNHFDYAAEDAFLNAMRPD
jgi:nucleoside-diphosphate-sugar epimerase